MVMQEEKISRERMIVYIAVALGKSKISYLENMAIGDLRNLYKTSLQLALYKKQIEITENELKNIRSWIKERNC